MSILNPRKFVFSEIYAPPDTSGPPPRRRPDPLPGAVRLPDRPHDLPPLPPECPPAARSSLQEPLPITEAALAVGAGEPSAFEVVRADQLAGPSEAMDFIEQLLVDGGSSVIYGQSNTGKSFWALDLACCVSTGRPFRDDMEIDQGAVIFVALEGTHGARNRVEALRLTGRLPKGAPLFLCFSPVSLLEPGHAVRLAETVTQVAAQSSVPCRLVILDTLARAMAGGDENSGQDMTMAVKAIDAVRAATGAHVTVVHHTGKDLAKGARGHSSLRAAIDTEIEVFRPDDEKISTVRVTKQRDMAPCEPMPFSLKVVELGTDRRGKPITSCVVFHEDSIMASGKGKVGRPQTTSVPHLLSMLPQPSTTAWKVFARSKHDVTATPFYNTLRLIRESGQAFYSKQGGWVLAEPNFGSDLSL